MLLFSHQLWTSVLTTLHTWLVWLRYSSPSRFLKAPVESSKTWIQVFLDFWKLLFVTDRSSSMNLVHKLRVGLCCVAPVTHTTRTTVWDTSNPPHVEHSAPYGHLSLWYRRVVPPHFLEKGKYLPYSQRDYLIGLQLPLLPTVASVSQVRSLVLSIWDTVPVWDRSLTCFSSVTLLLFPKRC